MTRKQKRWTVFAVINGLMLLAVPLYYLYVNVFLQVIPEQLTKCTAARFLHLYCTGCGGTRAVGALFRLDILTALRLNPFVPVAAGLFIYYDIRAALAIARDEPLAVKVPTAVWIGLPVFLLIMTVARNLALVYCGYDPIGDLVSFWQ